jgi:hypothetical protein
MALKIHFDCGIYNSVVIFISQNHDTINGNYRRRNQFIIISRLKIFPSKIIILVSGAFDVNA